MSFLSFQGVGCSRCLLKRNMPYLKSHNLDHTHIVVHIHSSQMGPSATTLRSEPDRHRTESSSLEASDDDTAGDLGLDSVPFADEPTETAEKRESPEPERQESSGQDNENEREGKGEGNVDRGELYGWGGTLETPPRVWVPRTPNAPMKTGRIDMRTLKHELEHARVFYEPPLPTSAIRFTTPLRLPSQPSTPRKVKVKVKGKASHGSRLAPRALVFL